MIRRSNRPTSLSWSCRKNKFGLHPSDEAKDNVVTASPSEPQLIELPARLYSMLTALLIIATALLTLTFVRH